MVRGFRRATATVELTPPPPRVVAPSSNLAWELGDLYCSARGCSQQTGLACSFVDRRQHPCPTAWCPQHRHVTRGAVFCPNHGRLLDGSAGEFLEAPRVDLDNASPLILAWVAQEVDGEVSTAMLVVAMEWHQALILDPVHFALIGPHRIRTWERGWKVCDNAGPTLRTSVVVEEANPGVVEARINARPVISLPVPWHASHGFGQRPQDPSVAREQVLDFRERLLSAMIRGIAQWRRENIGNREPFEATLRGIPQQSPIPPGGGWAASR